MINRIEYDMIFNINVAADSNIYQTKDGEKNCLE